MCALFCVAFCRRRWFWFWIALGYPFATDKKQKWICFRLCFWSVGWFSVPFINLCTSHSFICCCCCKCTLECAYSFISLSLKSSTFIRWILSTTCFEWFGAIHYCNSALLISIVDHLYLSLFLSLPFFFWFILYILHYNLFALVSLSSAQSIWFATAQIPSEEKCNTNSSNNSKTTAKNYDYVLQNCHHIKTNFYAIASEKRNIIKKFVLFRILFASFALGIARENIASFACILSSTYRHIPFHGLMFAMQFLLPSIFYFFIHFTLIAAQLDGRQ